MLRTACCLVPFVAAATLATQDAPRLPRAQTVDVAWWVEVEASPQRTRFDAPDPDAAVRLLMRDDGAEVRDIDAPMPDPRRDLAPGGAHVVSVREVDGARALFVQPARGGEAVQLTDGAGDDLEPRWEGDGESLVFRSDRSDRADHDWELWRVALDGGTPEQLTDGDGRVGRFALDRGRRRIALRRDVPTGEPKSLPRSRVEVVDLGSGTVRTIIDDGSAFDLAWSPDGTRLAAGVGSRLVVVDVAAGKTVLDVNTREFDADDLGSAAGGIVWRPDGAALVCRLAFLGQRGMGSEMPCDRTLWVVRLRDGARFRLAFPKDRMARPATARAVRWWRRP